MKAMKLLLTTLFATAIFFGCKPESTKEYVANTSRKASAFAGTWKGVSVVMTDNDAARKNFPNQTLNVTQEAVFTDLRLNLTVAGDAPSTFTVTGATPLAANLFGLTTGKWEVDDVAKVSQIRLINGTDTVRLGVYVLSDLAGNKLSLTRIKSLDGLPMVTYNYDLSR